MIGAMNLLSYFIHKFFPEPIPKVANSSSSKTNQTNKNAKVAAATAAIMHHQNAKS
jgi:Na+-transporting methylmalonyl-CoA/oxaloacetate decarboxylase gamma subunit